MLLPDVSVGRQLFCGMGRPIALGLGGLEIRGSSYIQGPQIIGSDKTWPLTYATLMVGPMTNPEAKKVPIPGALCGTNFSPYSLAVNGNAAIFQHLSVNGLVMVGSNLIAQGEVMSRCGGHILSAKKNFDIKHPTKTGWRLRHTCPEGPSNDVYIRGKISSKTEINLPEYWTELVDPRSITVSLTPIGSHQEIIVKRIGENKIFLQEKSGMPIEAFYHIFGERKDGERLIPEYKGETPDDYPGNNKEYSIVGWNYDVR